jgi:hypothetical protein
MDGRRLVCWLGCLLTALIAPPAHDEPRAPVAPAAKERLAFREPDTPRKSVAADQSISAAPRAVERCFPHPPDAEVKTCADQITDSKKSLFVLLMLSIGSVQRGALSGWTAR